MRWISRVIWLIPFAAHLGYILATVRFFPNHMGNQSGSQGASLAAFLAEWLVLILLANGAFLFIYLRLPKFQNKMLAVPQKDYWLANDDNRNILLGHLRGICETTLLLMNVFFLSVYQYIYQANVPFPVMHINSTILIGGFMVLPLFLAGVSMIREIRSLHKIPQQSTQGPATQEPPTQEPPPKTG